MKRNILILVVFTTNLLFAQGNREISYGLFAGGVYSKMSNIPDVIVPKGIYEGYNLNAKSKFGATGGVFINWKYPYAKVSIQTELSYSNQGTELNYDDTKGLNYKVAFNYNYINWGAQFKYYIIEGEGYYIGLGPSVGFNVSSDNIKYTSNAQEIFGNAGVYFEPDANVQKVLKESLTGKNYFYGQFSLGYEFKNDFFVGARYNLGLSDGLTTEENGHRYSENKNKINSFSFIIGYSFHFDDLANF